MRICWICFVFYCIVNRLKSPTKQIIFRLQVDLTKLTSSQIVTINIRFQDHSEHSTLLHKVTINNNQILHKEEVVKLEITRKAPLTKNAPDIEDII